MNGTSRSVPAAGLPLVSVVLTTRDRPRFLPVALACYGHQSYPNRELIVVDDGERFPADEKLVEAAGGRLLRVPPGTPIGTKLNHGVREARGWLCQKMDDDDWYAPRFLETMVSSILARRTRICRPTFAYLSEFLFFEVARWEVRRSIKHTMIGGTLVFAREDWARRPFRGISQDEDVWFVLDYRRDGIAPLTVPALEEFLYVRHHALPAARVPGGGVNRGHSWTHQHDGETVESYLQDRPLHGRPPEELLPPWAVDFYRQLRSDLIPFPAVS